MKALAALFGIATTAAIAWSGCGGGASADASHTITIRYSRFVPADVTVPAGRPVTIELRNDDPIEHEWIVGSEASHEAHRTGTEPYHDTRPTEVTIPALDSRTTTVVFEEPGSYRYICHLPGHEAYGMTGTLLVVER
jgi:uncharacterized cupredoxin-like copper-binding protein